tara:strand:+ start:18890 stop:19549 length:660 start_codon:yes stop_codon:yes gene_type:complete
MKNYINAENLNNVLDTGTLYETAEFIKSNSFLNIGEAYNLTGTPRPMILNEADFENGNILGDNFFNRVLLGFVPSFDDQGFSMVQFFDLDADLGAGEKGHIRKVFLPKKFKVTFSGNIQGDTEVSESCAVVATTVTRENAGSFTVQTEKPFAKYNLDFSASGISTGVKEFSHTWEFDLNNVVDTANIIEFGIATNIPTVANFSNNTVELKNIKCTIVGI